MAKKLKLTAKTANRYDLYEQSVQNVDFEVEFISKTFKKYNKSECTTLREDFCASAKISFAWIKSSPKNIAYAIDLDDDILGFAKKEFSESLEKNQLSRIRLIKGNSLTKKTPKVST